MLSFPSIFDRHSTGMYLSLSLDMGCLSADMITAFSHALTLGFIHSTDEARKHAYVDDITQQ